jgi:hypothetical protein
MHDDRYYGVQPMDGRVLLYSMRFAPGTNSTEAKAEVLRGEFPRDAAIRWFVVQDTCAQMLVVSRTLARVVGGNTAGLVEFTSGESGDHYTAADIWDAILTSAGSREKPGDIGC